MLKDIKDLEQQIARESRTAPLSDDRAGAAGAAKPGAPVREFRFDSSGNLIP